MPKRSNTFQKLILAIENQLAGKNTSVTESALLEDKRNGTKREVDILLESSISGIAVRIGVECRDHKRPQDLKWADELEGKLKNLDLDKMIAVSSSGFTNTAKEALESVGILALTLEDAITADWTKLIDSHRNITVVEVKKTITGVGMVLSPTVTAMTIRRIPNESELFDGNKNKLGSPRDLAAVILNQKEAFLEVQSKADAVGIPEEGLDIDIRIDLVEPAYVLSRNRKWCPIVALIVKSHVFEEKTTVLLDRYSYRRTQVASGHWKNETRNSREEVNFLLTQSEDDQKPKLGLTLSFSLKKGASAQNTIWSSQDDQGV